MKLPSAVRFGMSAKFKHRRPVIALLIAISIPNLCAQSKRPVYRIDAAIDYDLLTLNASAEITVPVRTGETMNDAVFFLYANSNGIVDDARRKYLVVDGVRLGPEAQSFMLQAAILRVQLATTQNRPFALKIDYHGVVPRSRDDGSGQLPGGLGGLLGSPAGKSAPANNDFGLYGYSGGILSLGSFWYPQLAVRKDGKWVDEVPQGLGDVTYAEASDFDVEFSVPANVKVITSGTASGAPGRYTASNVRDFAVLMSEDYTCKSKSVTASGKNITVESCARRKNAARLDSTLDVAGQALQIYSKRFGAYPYDHFKVAEGTIRGGAGGMEFSGMTAIAPMLYADWNQQLREMSGLLGGIGGLDGLLGGLNPGQTAEAGKGQPPTSPANGIGDLLGAVLGQQNVLESVLEMTVAHEVAHQWWAIAVGSNSVREPFVDESLTNYSAVLYFEDRYGKEAAGKMMNMHLKTPYSMARMLGFPDAPANLPTSAYSSSVQYSAVVYGKGALYYDALRRAVGDEVFFSALREYYQKYRGGLAGPRSLINLISAKAPAAGVEALYQHWIEETHGDQDIGGGQLGGLQEVMRELLKSLK